MRISLFLACIFVFLEVLGQSPHAQFSAQSTACLGENIAIQNQSTSAVRYEWDVCQGDLVGAPTSALSKSMAGNVTVGVDVVYDGANWFAFVTNQNAHDIIRLDFGADMNSIPIITHLGNVNGLINAPADIKIVYESGNWYGFVYGLVDPFVSRIDFGSSLTNTTSTPFVITATTLLAGAGSTNGGMDMIHDGSNWFIVLTDNNQLRTIRLPTVDGVPGPADISTATGNPFGSAMGDIFLQKSGPNYYGYVVAFGNKTMQRLNFGTAIFSTPFIDDISSILPASPTPYGLDGGWDNGELYIFVSTLQGNLLRLNMGSDLSQPPVSGVALGTFSTLENTLRVRLVKDKTTWTAFAPSWSSTNLYRINFPNPVDCGVSSVLTTSAPVLNFAQAGTSNITLRAFGTSGVFDEQSSSVSVSSNNAPQVTISYNGICLASATNFIVSSSATLSTHQWDFGDTASSSDLNPSHQYIAEGNYEISVVVSASLNGCTNFATKTISVYSEPDADFTLPADPVCTNNEYTMVNNTVDMNSSLSYLWYVDGAQTSAAKDLKYTFSTTVSKSIKLIAFNPGCSNEQVKTITNIQTGPTVGFTISGTCKDEVITLTNTSVGDIAGYLWDFGNGQTSSTTNASQTYSNTGDYIISLETTGTNGCISKTSKPLTIYSTPQPDFSLDLPPFSCAGSPSQFNDLTPGPIDSNISSWNWSFGDVASGSSATKNPTYTYPVAGTYDVLLTTTTNFGCEASVSKTVQIADPPKADFTTSASCLNQTTYFTDASTGINKSWLWKIGNTTYNLQNPAHVFSGTGNYTVQLTVTGSNDCIAVLSKPINVPVPPTLDFSVQNNCAGQSTIFLDTTPTHADPAVSRFWDFGGKGSGTGASTQFIFPKPAAYNVKLTATNQSGCTYSLAKNIPIVTSPIADFSSSVQSGPPPLTIQFTDASQYATSYQWQFNDANNSVSIQKSPSFTYTELGDFIVDLTTSNAQGCVDTKSQIIHVIIPRTEIELVEFKLLTDVKTGSVRPEIIIKNNSNYSVSGVDVLLDIAGNALVKEKISATILPNATSSQILNYELLPGGSQLDYVCAELQLTDDSDLTNNNACVNLESDEILFPPYPNPIQGELHLDWISPIQGSVKISVISQLGQMAYQKEVPNVGIGLNQIIVDLSKLNSGLYVLIFESQGKRSTFSISILN